jgi:hypothetical protein
MTPNRTSKELSIVELATAGFLSAIPSTVITAPVERAKVLLQVSPTVYCVLHRLIRLSRSTPRTSTKALLTSCGNSTGKVVFAPSTVAALLQSHAMVPAVPLTLLRTRSRRRRSRLRARRRRT